jgi:hypothetical protein
MSKLINLFKEIFSENTTAVFHCNKCKLIVIFKGVPVVIIKFKLIVFVWKEGLKVVVEPKLF